MYQIQNITSDGSQQRNLILPDGSIIDFEIRFVQMQYGWFITTLSYSNSDFTINGLRICNSPNMLRQWRHLIPFGLACFSTNDREPSQALDFSSGNSQLFILTADEVAQFEAALDG